VAGSFAVLEAKGASWSYGPRAQTHQSVNQSTSSPSIMRSVPYRARSEQRHRSLLPDWDFCGDLQLRHTVSEHFSAASVAASQRWKGLRNGLHLDKHAPLCALDCSCSMFVVACAASASAFAAKATSFRPVPAGLKPCSVTTGRIKSSNAVSPNVAAILSPLPHGRGNE
jgi:hypothetical protein